MADVRPIDANALLQDIEQVRNMVNAARAGLVRVDVLGLVLKAVTKAVTEAPTIEAEPVRHGRWIQVDSPWNGNAQKCNHCMETVKSLSGQLRFCPNCGAKMDSEV